MIMVVDTVSVSGPHGLETASQAGDTVTGSTESSFTPVESSSLTSPLTGFLEFSKQPPCDTRVHIWTQGHTFMHMNAQAHPGRHA